METAQLKIYYSTLLMVYLPTHTPSLSCLYMKIIKPHIQNQQYTSLNNAHTILVVVHWCAEVQLVLLLRFELQSIWITCLPVLHVNQLSLCRTHCQRNCISFVVVPRSVLLVHGWVFRPTVAVIRYLVGAVSRSRLELEHVGLSLFSNGDSNCYPAFDAFHLELYRLLLTPYTRLDQGQQSVLVVGDILHLEFFWICDLEGMVQKCLGEAVKLRKLSLGVEELDKLVIETLVLLPSWNLLSKFLVNLSDLCLYLLSYSLAWDSLLEREGKISLELSCQFLKTECKLYDFL